MKQENKKYKNKQMRKGFTIIELMFVIMLLIGLAFIAQNVMSKSTTAPVIASMVSDARNAIKTLNDYRAVSNNPLAVNYSELFDHAAMCAVDKNDNGISGDFDNEIKTDHSYNANTFPLKFSASGDNGIVVIEKTCKRPHDGYYLRVYNKVEKTGKMVEYNSCVDGKPRIVKDDGYFSSCHP